MNRNNPNPDDDHDELMGDLEDDFKDNRPPTRSELNQMRMRFEALEGLVRSLVKPTARTAVAQGESVLAKAVASFKDADALLSYADGLTDDPTQMGIISGHLATGDFRSAQNAVLELQQRSVVAKAAEELEAVAGAADTDLTTFDSHVAVSELTARFGSVERALAAIESRLGQLERRSNAAAPVPTAPAGPTVAKAVTGKKRAQTKEQIAADLMTKIDAYIDSPSLTGQLSSMVQAGQFDQVRAVVQRAEVAHQTEKVRQERKSWH